MNHSPGHSLRIIVGLALLAGVGAMFLRPIEPDLPRLKARAAALKAKQDSAHLEGDRIVRTLTGRQRDAALLKVPYLTPAEVTKLGELQDAIRAGK